MGRRRSLTLPFFFLLPSIILLLVMYAYPLVSSFHMSIYDMDLKKSEHPFVGLKNYYEVITWILFQEAFRHTVEFLVGYVSLTMLVGLITALVLNEQFKGKRVVTLLVIIPWAISPVVSGFMWKYIYNPSFGILNITLRNLHLISENVTWIVSYPMMCCIVAGVWMWSPFAVLVLLTGLQSIPGDLYESAMMDRANMLNRFRYITLPLLKPVFLLVLTLEMIWGISTFDVIYVLTKGGPANKTVTLYYLVYKHGFGNLKFGHAAAIAYIVSAMCVVLLVIYYKSLRRPEV